MISLFQYGQTVTLTLSELEDWKNQMRAELKMEIKTEIFQEMNTQLGNAEKTSQEIISLQELTQEVHNHTIQIETLGAELQETNILVGNQSTELNRLENKFIGFNETLIASFEEQAENLGAELQGTKTFVENKLIEYNQTLQESNNALNHSITAKTDEFQELLTDNESLHSEDKVELISNMTDLIENFVENELIGLNETLQESIIALNQYQYHTTTATNTTTTTKTTPSNCPASKEFKLIEGKCYTFENVKRTFDDTQTRSRKIFGNNIGGKIFEPQTDQVIQEVLKYAKDIWKPESPRIGVGITDKTSEGKFVYYSNGQSHTLPWGFASGSSNNSNRNCLLVHWRYIQSSNAWYKKLYHFNCSNASQVAICEWAI